LLMVSDSLLFLVCTNAQSISRKLVKIRLFRQLDRHALLSCVMVSSFVAIFSLPVALKEDNDDCYKIFCSGSRGRFRNVHSPSSHQSKYKDFGFWILDFLKGVLQDTRGEHFKDAYFESRIILDWHVLQ